MRASSHLLFLLFLLNSHRLAWSATMTVPAEFPTIQVAIDAAAPGDSVLVEPGIYSGPGNRDLDFRGKAITLHGVAGAASTVLDCAGSPTAPHRALIFQSGESSGAVVGGFTFRGGHASYGGAVYISYGSPIFLDCIFADNTASLNGGAVCLEGDPPIRDVSPSFERCLFQANTAAGDGGGLSCAYCSVSVEDCVLSGNSSVDAAGGAIFARATAFQLTDVTIDSSYAFWHGGGLYLSADCTGTIADCTMSRNVSEYYGGAIWLNGGSLTVTRCTFTANRAVSWARESEGGAMYCRAGSPAISNCAFVGNAAYLRGGALTFSGFGTQPTITACSFVEDSSRVGGAIASVGSAHVELTESLLERNWGYYSGSALRASGGSISGTNCTIVQNECCSLTGGTVSCSSSGTVLLDHTIVALSIRGSAVEMAEGTTATLRCVDLYGNAGDDWTDPIADQLGVLGNICQDPLFCGPSIGDFHLDASSPCLDAPGCSLIGALAQGCAGVGTGVNEEPPLIVDETWGGLKARWR